MVAQPSPRRLSVDEWRELERSSFDAKHEYIDGQVYLMSGGSRAHGRISSNAVRTLEDSLADKDQVVVSVARTMREKEALADAVDIGRYRDRFGSTSGAGIRSGAFANAGRRPGTGCTRL